MNKLTIIILSTLLSATLAKATEKSQMSFAEFSSFYHSCFKFIESDCLGKDAGKESMDCLLDHQTAIFSAEGGTACKEEFDKNTNRGYMEKKNGKFVAKPFPQELAKKLREKFDAIASNCQDDLPVVDLQINLDLMKLAGAQKINGPCAQFLKPQKQYASNAKLFEEMLIQCKDAVVSLCIGTALGPEFRKCMSEHEKKGDLEVACAKALDAVPPLPKEWNGEFMKAQALAMHQACEADLNTFKPKRNYILASHYSKLRPQCQQTLANLFPDLKTVEAHGGDNSAPIK